MKPLSDLLSSTALPAVKRRSWLMRGVCTALVRAILSACYFLERLVAQIFLPSAANAGQ